MNAEFRTEIIEGNEIVPIEKWRNSKMKSGLISINSLNFEDSDDRVRFPNWKIEDTHCTRAVAPDCETQRCASKVYFILFFDMGVLLIYLFIYFDRICIICVCDMG